VHATKSYKGKKRYGSNHTKLGDKMEVSGQIQAPAAFFLRKEGSRRGLECFREQKEIFYASS
jgi:hypothetical protein